MGAPGENCLPWLLDLIRLNHTTGLIWGHWLPHQVTQNVLQGSVRDPLAKAHSLCQGLQEHWPKVLENQPVAGGGHGQ
jgi:hypothetical protein